MAGPPVSPQKVVGRERRRGPGSSAEADGSKLRCNEGGLKTVLNSVEALLAVQQRGLSLASCGFSWVGFVQFAILSAEIACRRKPGLVRFGFDVTRGDASLQEVAVPQTEMRMERCLHWLVGRIGTRRGGRALAKEERSPNASNWKHPDSGVWSG